MNSIAHTLLEGGSLLSVAYALRGWRNQHGVASEFTLVVRCSLFPLHSRKTAVGFGFLNPGPGITCTAAAGGAHAMRLPSANRSLHNACAACERNVFHAVAFIRKTGTWWTIFNIYLYSSHQPRPPQLDVWAWGREDRRTATTTAGGEYARGDVRGRVSSTGVPTWRYVVQLDAASHHRLGRLYRRSG